MTESTSPPTTQSTKLAGRTSRKESGRWSVARVSELTPGSMKLVEVKGLSIGLFNVHGEFVAVLNLCPHELAPVCRGRLGERPSRLRPANTGGVAKGRSSPARGTAGNLIC